MIGVSYTTTNTEHWSSVEADETTPLQVVDSSQSQQTPETVVLEEQSHEAIPLDGITPVFMETTLISVSHEDESKFTPEEWARILEQIEDGTVYWED